MCLNLVLAGCPALPILIPPLVQFGASMLNSAVKNYDEPHQQNMQSLLTALQQRTNPFIAQGITTHPNNQMGDQSSPDYPNQDYQTGQGYPPSQDYSQQDYDPYQNSQSGYEENPQYPIDQDPNQFPQGDDPYANHSGFPSQQTPPSGYPPEQQGYPPQPGYQQYPQHGQPYQNPDEETKVPISLDVLLVKKHLVNGVKSYLPIKDGDVLFDGRGNPQAGDKFRVMFRANTNCYVYVIAVDGTAWAQGIFPPASNPFANPVKAGQQYLLPEGNNWFSLDQFKGIETIFFVASHERRPDIEQYPYHY